MPTINKPIGRPVGTKKPEGTHRIKFSTTVDPRTYQRLLDERLPGEGIGNVLDRIFQDRSS